MKTAVLVFVLASALYSVADAKEAKLPPGTRALPEFRVTSIYANRTIQYPSVRYYFSPDGALIGYAKDRRSFADGSWDVDGNQICIKSIWHSVRTRSSAKYVSCYAWYSVGDAFWTQIVRGEGRGNVYKGDASLLTSGDHVSEVVSKIKGNSAVLKSSVLNRRTLVMRANMHHRRKVLQPKKI